MKTVNTFSFSDDSANSILKHAINSVYALSNFLICAKPYRILHVYQSMILGAVYIIFSAIYQEISGDVIYDALDWTSLPGTPLMAMGVLFIVIPLVHIALFSLYRLRILVSTKLCNKSETNSQGTFKESNGTRAKVNNGTGGAMHNGTTGTMNNDTAVTVNLEMSTNP